MNHCPLTRTRRRPAAGLLILLGLLPLLCLLIASRKTADYEPPLLRVKLAGLGPTTTVSAPGLQWTAGGRNGRADTVALAWDGKSAAVNGRAVSLPLAFTASGPISVDGYPFRGGIEIAAGPPPIVINVVDVESYVTGVINHEIDSRWPAAAVDAQAVIIRTYAIKRRRERHNGPFDLDRTASDQVYGGQAAEDEASRASVQRTRGRVLTWQGQLALAQYHACCGGRTELPSAVWGGQDQPWQQSVACGHCQDAPRYFWRWPESGAEGARELAAALGLTGEVLSVTVTHKTATGRAGEVEVRTRGDRLTLTGQELRKRIGYDRLWSTSLTVESGPDGFVFRGGGSGHGVGLCQWGARDMALKGLAAEAILRYYYPGAAVELWRGD
jgi:stage II sporulation protein D